MMSVDLDLLENEHLIGRLKLIELLERRSPYRDMPEGVERRFAQALRMVPPEHQQAALAVFASVRYIGKHTLFDAWRYLWSLLGISGRAIPSMDSILFLELDRDMLRDEFYRANVLAGRLQDNIPWRSTHDIIDVLMNLEGQRVPPEMAESLRTLTTRRLWVLLVDLSLSGTSAVSELAKLHKIRSLFFAELEIEIIALIQLGTEVALESLKESGYRYHCAIQIPKTHALNDPEYNLLSDHSLIESMREMCKWFANAHVLPTSYRLATLSREEHDPDIAIYGFGKAGWSIVTYRNSPNNSLPILWFKPPGEQTYRPPFERIDSRIGKPWTGRRDWLERAENEVALRDKVSNYLREKDT